MAESDDARAKEYEAGLDALMDHYLAHGCPCRFPRFRSTCDRNTVEVGLPSYTSTDQQGLIRRYEQRTPAKPISDTRRGRLFKCTLCGASVERYADQPNRDVFIAYLHVKPAKGVADLGAPVDGPLFHCAPLWHADVANKSEEDLLGISYPTLPLAQWLDWMRKLR
jgi:hypothetical protein